ncbi:hypothetical protein LUZ60_011590 [Juncus effusus]|nr:hypothetical protein LUZ60_011590 [Juncus effusus]
MGGQGKGSSNTSASSMQRVKLYRLNEDGKWDDMGTGHVTVEYMEGSKELGLLVADEEDNETLLAHSISPDDIYRRQEDTIISWRDPELATELALSFQEATGCSYIWENIGGIQRNMHFNNLGGLEVSPRPAMVNLEPSRILQSNDGSFRSGNSDMREIPPVELSSLPLLLKTILESSIADQMRVAELISQDQEFFPKLVDLFKMCEDLENMDGLQMIYKLVRGIILFNNPAIFDKIFSDEFIMDIIGALEYEPDVSKTQKHRSFLKDHVVFKEAIPIKNSMVLTKIHQSYRVGYIKDVILPRVLDDGTIASLNSIVHANNAAVISMLKDDSCFIQELFAKMKSPDVSEASRRDLVLFLHEFCTLSKSLQIVQQLRLFRDLANEGVFEIMADVLQSQDKKIVSAGTDILILFLNQDPNLLRSFIIQQEGNTLLGLLVKGMLTDFGEYMHCQFLEIIRILMDAYTMSGSQRDAIIEIFYERHLDQLVDVIAQSCPPRNNSRVSVSVNSHNNNISSFVPAKSEILMNICELLCFCVIHHPYRIKCNFLMNNAIEKILMLTRRRERVLAVAAVRFMRTIISRNDEHLLRHIVKNNLLKPVIEAFCENGNRYNMLHSGILELIEYIRKDNLKPLVIYVVETFAEQLKKFEHLGSIQALKIKYEQCLENNEQKTENNNNIGEARKRGENRGLEKEEEDYFNEDSDEEDSAGNAPHGHGKNTRSSTNSLPNGTKSSMPSIRPNISGGIVDYEDDEDDEDYNPPVKKPDDPSEDDDDDSLLSVSKNKRKINNNNNNNNDGRADLSPKKAKVGIISLAPKKEEREVKRESETESEGEKRDETDEMELEKEEVKLESGGELSRNGSESSGNGKESENESGKENESCNETQLSEDCSATLNNSEPYPVR